MEILSYNAIVTIQTKADTAPAKLTMEFGGAKSMKRDELAMHVAEQIEKQLAILGGHDDLEAQIQELKATAEKAAKKLSAALAATDKAEAATMKAKEDAKVEVKKAKEPGKVEMPKVAPPRAGPRPIATKPSAT